MRTKKKKRRRQEGGSGDAKTATNFAIGKYKIHSGRARSCSMYWAHVKATLASSLRALRSGSAV